MLSSADRIHEFTQRVELLAPAGRWDALEAVLDAGADAVYLGLKRLNMRMHRSDFHFTESQVADAVALAHRGDKRIYVTLNALLAESDLEATRAVLIRLDAIGADAVIVQDLAVARLAAELDLSIPLHASTMTNVHHAEQARALKDLGFSRIITSRDIDIRTAGEIGRAAGIEVEYFVHGDMCVSHSGQCGISGVLFGKSANRGECMKPCRWEYDLVSLDGEEPHGHIAGGHLLSINDLCLLRHVPDLIQAGIRALKIEGRMRDAPYLGHLVASYRQAIDAYYDCPPAFALSVAAIEQTYRQQVRAMSTLTTLGGSSHRGMFDVSGQRETMFLSNGCRESDLDEEVLPPGSSATLRTAGLPAVDLAVSVSTAEAAAAAIRGGADRVYLAAERSQRESAPWSIDAMIATIDATHRAGATLGIRTPRITTQREWAETDWLLRRFAEHAVEYVLVHHLGTLRLARERCPQAEVIADYGFNLLNGPAVDVLADLGVDQATLSNEAGLRELAALAESTSLPLEILAHGPITGMLIDHCVIALNATSGGRKDVCRGPCRHVAFGLRDRAGAVRPIVADQHCRNHLLTAHDLAVLPALDAFLFPAVRSIRIEAQFYASEWTEIVTRAYRTGLDAAAGGPDEVQQLEDLWEDLSRRSPRPMSFGPYARSIVNSAATVHVMRELVHQ